jgi:EmrB/QacA subfamily drug resistance transporter
MDEKIDAYVWRIAFVVVLGSIASILDTTIVNVALHSLGEELHTTLSDIQWVITGYLLSLAAVIPVSGWAAKRFGAKRVYIVSIVVFTAGSALCGFATSTRELILFRVLQGFGGGMILPVGQLMLARAAGPHRMGRVMGVTSVPAMLAPVLGPTIGGVILDNTTWRWIFFVNVPVGTLAVLAAIRILPHGDREPAGRLDVRGLALMSISLPLITYGLAEIGATGSFTGPKVVFPLVGGVVLLAIFALHALRAPRPLLDLRLYSRRTFAASSVTMFCLSAALFGASFLMPFYWQTVRSEDVLLTGLLLAPMGAGLALAMPFAGRLADRLGGGLIALAGTIITTLATLPFCFIGASTPILWLSIAMAIRGMGAGIAFVPAMTAAFASLRPSELPDATPQLNVLQRVGGSLGVAALAVVLQRALASATSLHEQAAAYGTAFWWSTTFTAAAIVPCLLLVRAERAARGQAGSAAPAVQADPLVESAL